jgi:hypothetical protein
MGHVWTAPTAAVVHFFGARVNERLPLVIAKSGVRQAPVKHHLWSRV